ncbi:hypothetical protein [Bacillus sp. 1P06AnD]|uniref:hypothetical protein n=1 Tax=Bacillus sp. 1P06AnD TaxID=3132208 RepID=UPI0039A19BF9
MKIQTEHTSIEISSNEVIAALAVGAISIWATASIVNNLIQATTDFGCSKKREKYERWKKAKGKEKKRLVIQ